MFVVKKDWIGFQDKQMIRSATKHYTLIKSEQTFGVGLDYIISKMAEPQWARLSGFGEDIGQNNLEKEFLKEVVGFGNSVQSDKVSRLNIPDLDLYDFYLALNRVYVTD